MSTGQKLFGLNAKLIIKITALLLLLLCPACKAPYQRPAEKINVGKVADFLTPYRHVQSRGILVYRDEKGWSALGTRCSYDGCDLTYQPNGLVCSCCGSVFDGQGLISRGPAEKSLLWYELLFEDGYLFADSGKVVPADYRYNSPELQALVKELEERAQREMGKGDTQIPKILQGTGDGEGGVMFVEPKPQDFKERYDIDPTK